MASSVKSKLVVKPDSNSSTKGSLISVQLSGSISKDRLPVIEPAKETNKMDEVKEKQKDQISTSSTKTGSSICPISDDDPNISLSTNQIDSNKISQTSEPSSSIKDDRKNEKHYPGQALRKPSYQKAMANKKTLPKYVPGILLEDSQSPVEECAGLTEDISASTKLNQSFSSDSPRSTSPLQHESPDKSLPSLDPQDSPTGSNISRSVSFNDRLLDNSRRPPLESFKCSSVESSISNIESPSLQSTANVRLLQSTPGRLQIISKHSSETSSPEGDFYRSSVTTVTREKNTMKNFTSNLVRKISFRKNKINKKQIQENTLESTIINGIPPSEEGVVSYEELLKLFKCPGCHTFMAPPLLQCRKGHIVCDKCKINFKATCPICKQRVTDATNYMMEQVCQLVRFPCSFMKYGCHEYHSPKHRIDHEHFCIYRPVHCHYESAGCEHILPLKEMNAHISSCPFKYKSKQI